MSLLELEIADGIGTITLNNDAKRNSLSDALIEELIEALESFRKEAVRCVVFRSHPGVKVFSAGHDVTELPRSRRDPLAYDDPLERGVRALRKFPAPIIALVEGSVWGGACELVACCDIPVGTPKTTFAITPAKIGVPYNASGILRLASQVKISVLREMFFTAEPVDALRARSCGLLNHVVASEHIEEFVYNMAHRIASLAPLSIAVAKEQIRLISNASPMDPETFERIQGLRRRVYDSADYAEGIEAFLEKRKPMWKGC